MNEETISLNFKLSPKLSEALLTLYHLPVIPIAEADAVLMHRLRKEMKQHRININSKRHLGYWLSEEHKLHIKSVLETNEPLSWMAFPDGKGFYHSPSWLARYGLSEKDAMGYGYREVLHDADRATVIAAIEERGRTGTFPTFKARMRCTVDGFKWFSLSAQAVLNSAGVLIYWIGTNVPI